MSLSQTLSVERLAEAMWDARESRDPSGERTGYTESDQAREAIFWKRAVDEDRWPGSREDQLREAALVLELLGAIPEDDATATKPHHQRER